MGKVLFVKVNRKNLQNPEGPSKTYAQAQHRAEIDLDQLGEHIASHGCSYDEGDVTAIAKKIVKCVRDFLCDGYIVRLGDMGKFFITISSNGVMESVPDEQTGEKPVFNASDITGINVNWSPSAKFESDELMRNVEFEETITTKAKAKVIKAKKEAMSLGTYKQDADFVEITGGTTTGSGNNANGNDEEEDVETHE